MCTSVVGQRPIHLARSLREQAILRICVTKLCNPSQCGSLSHGISKVTQHRFHDDCQLEQPSRKYRRDRMKCTDDVKFSRENFSNLAATLREAPRTYGRSFTSRRYFNTLSRAGNVSFSRMPSARNHSPKKLFSTCQCCSEHEGKYETSHPMPKDKAFIALGSNIGDRLANLEAALIALNQSDILVTRTSALYETAPMYVEDQATFYNAVCEVKIPPGVTPLMLLDEVKQIEDKLGRVKTVKKGPRVIDLDIVSFGQETVAHERLSVPHHSILEREFVLRPLADLVPHAQIPGLEDKSSVETHLQRLDQELHSSITPLRNSVPPLAPDLPSASTQVMGIFNMTPDSFSDGGKNSIDPSSVQMQEQLSSWLASKATILDIGGQSTAPKAPLVSAEEELSRVLPLIKHIRSDPRFDGIAISIDTFRAPVARAAVEAGADIVNDVSAGTLDPDMLFTVAQLRVPVVLMHMRGDPSTMNQMCDYPDGLLVTIGRELKERVDAAMAAGIPRWRIILDPGIGFAKQKAQNVEILRGLVELGSMDGIEGYPWLIGTSRKRFIGHITGEKKADQRDWGTAAAVTTAIAYGADIVRVHNPKMVQTATMADAIWREESTQDKV